MRALSLHPDVVVVTSSVWQTTATLVRGPGGTPESICVDSPVLPVELDAVGKLADTTGFDVQGLLATHADWDHLLGPLAFPDAVLGVDERSAARLTARIGEPQRRLRSFDEEWCIDRPQPLRLGELQALPVPGQIDLGDQVLEAHDGAGHTGDGLMLWVPWADVLIVGDYLSPVELPSWDEHGSREAYRHTLDHLAELVPRARYVVVGHGGPIGRVAALKLLDEDRDYLESGTPPQQRGRRSASATQHAANLVAWNRAATPLPAYVEQILPGPAASGSPFPAPPEAPTPLLQVIPPKLPNRADDLPGAS